MFRLNKVNVDGKPFEAPHRFEPYGSGNRGTFSAKGYRGEASRSGYGSYFGTARGDGRSTSFRENIRAVQTPSPVLRTSFWPMRWAWDSRA